MDDDVQHVVGKPGGAGLGAASRVEAEEEGLGSARERHVPGDADALPDGVTSQPGHAARGGEATDKLQAGRPLLASAQRVDDPQLCPSQLGVGQVHDKRRVCNEPLWYQAGGSRVAE